MASSADSEMALISRAKESVYFYLKVTLSSMSVFYSDTTLSGLDYFWGESV